MSHEYFKIGLANAATVDWTIFFFRLGQAIAWCDDRIEVSALRTSLRSPKLEPPHLRLNREDEVRSVVSRRNWELGRPADVAEQMPDLRGGRLLAYFPDADLCDGAAEDASGGFFDIYNMPPWDTWVSYFEDPVEHCYANYVVCYVPRLAISAAEIGITVNPEECIKWLADTDTILCRRLQSLKNMPHFW